jgi:hypothetical protein
VAKLHRLTCKNDCEYCGRHLVKVSSLPDTPRQDAERPNDWHFETCPKMPEKERKRYYRMLVEAEKSAGITKSLRTAFSHL